MLVLAAVLEESGMGQPHPARRKDRHLRWMDGTLQACGELETEDAPWAIRK